MRPLGKQRLAQRHEVPTTPVRWQMRRADRGPRSRFRVVEVALIEVSVMGAGIVAPEQWAAPMGSRSEMYWEEMSGLVVVRRVTPFPPGHGLVLYGVEYCDGRSLLGPALYKQLVTLAPPNPGKPIKVASITDAADMAAVPRPEPLAWMPPVTFAPPVVQPGPET